MSNVKRQYQESYRFIRMTMNGVFQLPPVAADWDSRFRPFMWALVSFDQRRVEPTGWRNLYRYYLWCNRKDSFNHYSEIPW